MCRSKEQIKEYNKVYEKTRRKKRDRSEYIKTYDILTREKRSLKRKSRIHEAKNYHLKKKYGMTLDEYNLLFLKQEGKCAICEKHQSTIKNSLCVDHNHITGEIRGLICQPCNLIVGLCNERIEVLLNTIEYINSYVRKAQK